MPGRHSVVRRGLVRGLLLRGALLAALVPCLGACSTIVLYNEPGAPNLHFGATSNGKFLMYTTILLDIHRVTAECRAEYVGSHNVWAPLAQTTDPVHLPEERLSLLEFKFHSHGNIESWTSYATLLRPRASHTYAATVTYDAGLYDVEIREIDPHGAPGRKIEHRSLSECRGA